MVSLKISSTTSVNRIKSLKQYNYYFKHIYCEEYTRHWELLSW